MQIFFGKLKALLNVNFSSSLHSNSVAGQPTFSKNVVLIAIRSAPSTLKSLKRRATSSSIVCLFAKSGTVFCCHLAGLTSLLPTVAHSRSGGWLPGPVYRTPSQGLLLSSSPSLLVALEGTKLPSVQLLSLSSISVALESI